MIPRIIHQVYGIFQDGKSLSNIPIFEECNQKTISFAKEHHYDYRLWDHQDAINLIHKYYPQYKQLWEDFTQPIMKADFIRYLILYHYGGIYIDMDIYPIQPFDDLLDNEQVFAKWSNDTKSLPYNALMMSEKHNVVFWDIAAHSKISFYDKIKIDVYQEWKGRLVFQTTGHFMINRVLKKYKIKPMDILKINSKDNTIISGDNPYFEDYNASIWYKS